MEAGIRDVDANLRRWWLLFGIALFLFVPFDLFTTLSAISRYGTAVEANPVMSWLVSRGVLAVLLAHLLVVVLAVALFHGFIGLVRRAQPADRRLLIRALTGWMALLLLGGVLLAVNNVLVLL